MSIESKIEAYVYIFTLCLCAWFILGIILAIIAYFKFLGFNNAFNATEYQELGIVIFAIIVTIIYIIFIILTFFVYFSTSLFLMIFGLWLVVLIFVPFVILIPIPFIPFVLPIPLKFLILEYVPPFKTLTKNGILPACKRIIFSMFEYFPKGLFGTWVLKSMGEIYNFIYEDIKLLFINIGKATGLDIEAIKPSNEKIEDNYPIEQEAPNEDAKIKDDDETKQIMNLINDEINICIKSKQQFKTPDTSSLNDLDNSSKSVNIYSECQAQGIKSYFDNLI